MQRYNSISEILAKLEQNSFIELDFKNAREIFPSTESSGLQFDEPSMESVRNFCDKNLIYLEIVTSSGSKDLPRYIFKKHDHT